MNSTNTLRICKSYKDRLEKLSTLLEYPEFNVDYNFSKRFLKEISKLKPIVELYDLYLISDQEIEKQDVLSSINKLIIEDKVDEYDGIKIEISSKDLEAKAFLQKSYQTYFSSCQYKVIEDDGLIILGTSIYSIYKNETGIHLYKDGYESEVKVLVLPYIESKETEIPLSDLRIDYYHSSGAGGQNVNKVETAIRITHIDTNIVVTCQDERSQLKNKQRALELINRKVNQYYLDKVQKEIDSIRKVAKNNKTIIRTIDVTKNELFDTRTQKKYNISDVFKSELGDIDSEILVNEVK